MSDFEVGDKVRYKSHHRMYGVVVEVHNNDAVGAAHRTLGRVGHVVVLELEGQSFLGRVPEVTSLLERDDPCSCMWCSDRNEGKAEK